MFTGYHNHAVEFAPMDGELPWDTFFGNTRDDVVMQIDTGNAPPRRCRERAVSLNATPAAPNWCISRSIPATNDKVLIGEGDVPWDEVFHACETLGGTEWYIVEQESYAYPPIECVERCIDNLRKMGKI